MTTVLPPWSCWLGGLFVLLRIISAAAFMLTGTPEHHAGSGADGLWDDSSSGRSRRHDEFISQVVADAARVSPLRAEHAVNYAAQYVMAPPRLSFSELHVATSTSTTRDGTNETTSSVNSSSSSSADDQGSDVDDETRDSRGHTRPAAGAARNDFEAERHAGDANGSEQKTRRRSTAEDIVLTPQLRAEIRAYLKHVGDVDQLKQRVRELLLVHGVHSDTAAATGSGADAGRVKVNINVSRKTGSSPRRRRRLRFAAAQTGNSKTPRRRDDSNSSHSTTNGTQDGDESGRPRMLRQRRRRRAQEVPLPEEDEAELAYTEDVGRGFSDMWVQEAVLKKLEVEFCRVPRPGDVTFQSINRCDADRGYGCVQDAIVPTVWSGPFLAILLDGWLCRLNTLEEQAGDYDGPLGTETTRVSAEVNCIPPRIRYFYFSARYIKKHRIGFQFRSPECKVDYCRNPLVDNPYMPRDALRSAPALSEENQLGGSYLDKLPPFFLSGEECNGDISNDVWKAGQKLVWMLA